MKATAATILFIQLTLATAFTQTLWKPTPACHHRTTQLYLSASDSAPPTIPPLQAKEIKEILDQVPVYAISSIENGSILLVEEDTKNVANFFLSKEFADTVAYGHDDTLRVDSYSLGKVYFQFFDPDESKDKEKEITVITTNDQDVEYRLLPDTREVDQAQLLLSQMAGVDDTFAKGFNEVPLFMDQHIRLAIGSEEQGDYKEIFPMYFGWNDLATTCQEYVKAYADSGEAYDAAISVSELEQLVEQMKKPSPVDFRNVQFVPASPRPLDS